MVSLRKGNWFEVRARVASPALAGIFWCSLAFIVGCGGIEPEYRAGPATLQAAKNSAGAACGVKETVAPASAGNNTAQGVPASSAPPSQAAIKVQSGTPKATAMDTQVFELLSSTSYGCTGCHYTTEPHIRSVEDAIGKAAIIKDSIDKNRMPKPGYKKVSAADKKTIVTDWKPSSVAAGASLTGAATYNAEIKSIVVTHCLSCHNVGGKEPILATYSLLKKNFDASLAAVLDGSMPPSGGLKQAEVAALKEWQAGQFELGESSAAGSDPLTSTGAANCQ